MDWWRRFGETIGDPSRQAAVPERAAGRLEAKIGLDLYNGDRHIRQRDASVVLDFPDQVQSSGHTKRRVAVRATKIARYAHQLKTGEQRSTRNSETE